MSINRSDNNEGEGKDKKEAGEFLHMVKYIKLVKGRILINQAGMLFHLSIIFESLLSNVINLLAAIVSE